MYAAICRRIIDVERELEDVKELLSSNVENQGWEVEWMNIVQDVLEKDAGWKYGRAHLSPLSIFTAQS